MEKASADITSLGGTVWTDGNPGMGFNLENAPFGCSGTNGDYGFTSFTATDAAAVPLSLSSHREMSQPQVLESQDAAWFADPPPTALSIDDFDLVQHPVGNSGPDGGGTRSGPVDSQNLVPTVPSVSPLGLAVLATFLAWMGATRAGSASRED